MRRGIKGEVSNSINSKTRRCKGIDTNCTNFHEAKLNALKRRKTLTFAQSRQASRNLSDFSNCIRKTEFRVKNLDTAYAIPLFALLNLMVRLSDIGECQWQSRNAGLRDEFLLGIFPPDRGGNHTLLPQPTQTPPEK